MPLAAGKKIQFIEVNPYFKRLASYIVSSVI